MYHRKAFVAATALALAAGALLMPAGTFARGAGGFHGGAHGPVFGSPRARIAVHRPIGPRFVHRAPARFGFRLNAFRHRGQQRNDANAVYGGDGSYGGYGSPYYGSNDLTGSVAGPGYVPLAPPAYSAEHAGCLSRSYDVPGESGGKAKVTVIRC